MKYLWMIFAGFLLISGCSHTQNRPLIPELTAQEKIEQKEKELEAMPEEWTEDSFYKEAFQALNDGYSMTAIHFFQTVVDMKGKKAKKSRRFIGIIKKSNDHFDKMVAARQKDVIRKLEMQEDTQEIKAVISIILDNKALPKKFSAFFRRFYNNLLKQGFSKTEVLDINPSINN